MRMILPLLALVACDTWDRFPDRRVSDYPATWSAERLVAAEDGLYVPLSNGRLVRVDASGSTEVELDGLVVESLERTLAGNTVLARGDIHLCADEDARSWEDCDPEDRSIEGSTAVLQDGIVATSLDVPAWYRAFQHSVDGRFAVSSLDPTLVTPGTGVVSLDSLLVADLQAGTTWEVAVGFAADEVLFTEDGDGATDGVVVLSNNEVAVIDLTTQVPLPEVVFPLTLDTNALIDPVGIELTPSGEHALITVQSSSDLYALDLLDPSVNIVGLAGSPVDMAIDPTGNRTALVYGASVVEFVDHDFFGVDQLVLPAPAGRILMADDYALLWNPNGSALSRVDNRTNAVEEYRLNFRSASVQLSPDEDFAVVFSNDNGLPRMEILNLVPDPDDGRLDNDPRPFALDGEGVGVAFIEGETTTDLLILQRDVDTLYQLTWPTLALETVELAAAPTRIGAQEDGSFWIAHDDPLGLISFYTPGSTPVAIGNFALPGLLDDAIPLAPEAN